MPESRGGTFKQTARTLNVAALVWALAGACLIAGSVLLSAELPGWWAHGGLVTGSAAGGVMWGVGWMALGIRRDHETAAQLTEAREELADVLEWLWEQLGVAVHSAFQGCWSSQCESITEQIIDLTGLVGPARWQNVPAHLLEAGIYQRIHDEAGVAVDVDMDQVRQVSGGLTPLSRDER